MKHGSEYYRSKMSYSHTSAANRKRKSGDLEASSSGKTISTSPAKWKPPSAQKPSEEEHKKEGKAKKEEKPKLTAADVFGDDESDDGTEEIPFQASNVQYEKR